MQVSSPIPTSNHSRQGHVASGHWELNLKTNCTCWSDRMFQIFRRDVRLGPPTYDELLELLHPEDQDRVQAVQRRFMESEGREVLEYSFRTNPDLGPMRYTQAITHGVRDDQGNLITLIGTVRDVTEQHFLELLGTEQNIVLEMIAGGAPLTSILIRLARAIEAHSDELICSILLVDKYGKHLRHGAAPSLPTNYIKAIDGLVISNRSGSCGTAAFRRERVVVTDIQTDPLWTGCRQLAESHGLRACWSTPILDSHQRVLGTFGIYYRKPGAPTVLHRKLVDLATHTAAICIELSRTETSLHDSHQRLQVALDASGMGVWEWDISSNSIKWSRECYEIIRQYPDSMNLDAFIAYIHPEDRPRVSHAIKECLAERTHYALEFRVTGNDSKERWVAYFGNLDCDPQGRPGRMIGTMQDITRRKQIESALQNSEQRLRDIIENEPECVSVLDGDGSLVEMNPAGLQTLQAASLAEIISRPLTEFVAPEHRDAFQQLHRQVMQGEPGQLVFEIIGKKGRRLWMESHAVPLRNPQGKVHAMLAVTRDITERQRFEASMHQRLALEERLSQLAATVPGVIYSFRLRNDGRVCLPYASPTMEDISGYRPEELVDDGAKFFQRIHHADIQGVWDSILESARHLTPWRQEFRFERPGKDEIWLEGYATPEREPDCAVLWHGFLHDVTLRKQAETDRQKLISKLLHSEDVERRRIARELHDTTAQHLAATKLNLTRLLQNSATTREEQKQALQDSLNLVEQAVHEVRTLTYVLHPPLLDELGLVGAMRDYAVGIERRSGIQITVDAEGYPGRLPHDIEIVLFRVIQESLTNVLRHSANANVLIRLEQDDGEVRLEVQDSGHRTVTDDTKTDTKFLRRTGVGIASMRERLRHVGGKLTIESDSEGVTVLANIPMTSERKTEPTLAITAMEEVVS